MPLAPTRGDFTMFTGMLRSGSKTAQTTTMRVRPPMALRGSMGIVLVASSAAVAGAEHPRSLRAASRGSSGIDHRMAHFGVRVARMLDGREPTVAIKHPQRSSPRQ